MREIHEDLILFFLLILKYKISIEVVQKNYDFPTSTSPVEVEAEKSEVHNLVLI